MPEEGKAVKSVRFMDSHNIREEHEINAGEYEVPSNIWYQHQELRTIKRKALVVAQDARRYGFGSLLTNTYGNSGEEAQESLNVWSRSGDSRRGLERFINEEYAAKRDDVKRRNVQSVIKAQEKLNESKQKNANAADILARLSEAFSRDAKAFARMIGKADATAAAKRISTHAAKEPQQGLATSKILNKKRSPSAVLATKTVWSGERCTLGSSEISGAPDVLRHFY